MVQLYLHKTLLTPYHPQAMGMAHAYAHVQSSCPTQATPTDVHLRLPIPQSHHRRRISLRRPLSAVIRSHQHGPISSLRSLSIVIREVSRVISMDISPLLPPLRSSPLLSAVIRSHQESSGVIRSHQYASLLSARLPPSPSPLHAHVCSVDIATAPPTSRPISYNLVRAHPSSSDLIQWSITESCRPISSNLVQS